MKNICTLLRLFVPIFTTLFFLQKFHICSLVLQASTQINVWILISWIFCLLFWAVFEPFLSSFNTILERNLAYFELIFELIFEQFWSYFEFILKTFWVHFENILGSFFLPFLSLMRLIVPLPAGSPSVSPCLISRATRSTGRFKIESSSAIFPASQWWRAETFDPSGAPLMDCSSR